MELKKANQVIEIMELLNHSKKRNTQLQDIKEFTQIRIHGEDGAEHERFMQISYNHERVLIDKIMNVIEDHYKEEIRVYKINLKAL